MSPESEKVYKATRESPSFIISYECLGLKMNADVMKGVDGIKVKLDEANFSGKGMGLQVESKSAMISDVMIPY